MNLPKCQTLNHSVKEEKSSINNKYDFEIKYDQLLAYPSFYSSSGDN